MTRITRPLSAAGLPPDSPELSPVAQVRRSWFPVTISILTTVLICAGAFWHYRSDSEEAHERIEAELSGIATLKVQDVTDWREERLSDARFFGRAPFVREDVQRLLANPMQSESREAVETWLRLLKGGDRYEQVAVLDLEGNRILSLPEVMMEDRSVLRMHVQNAVKQGAAVIGQLQEREERGKLHLDVVVPVYAPSGGDPLATPAAGEKAPMAVLLLRIDPEQALFPLVRQWPMPTKTGEVFLFRKEDEKIVYLTDMQDQPEGSPRLRFPLSSPDLPSAIALRTNQHRIEGIDYRGKQVQALVRRIPDSPWLLEAKVDQSEIYAPLRQEAINAAIACVALGLATLGGFGWFWRKRETLSLRRELRAEIAARLAGEQLAGLVESAMDAIVSVDESHRIVLFNPAAEQMFGMTEAEALGQTLDRLIPEDFRTRHSTHMDTFAERGQTRRRFGALGNVFGLRADGERFPVEVSISRVEVSGKRYFSAIMRDITERIAAETQPRRSSGRAPIGSRP